MSATSSRGAGDGNSIKEGRKAGIAFRREWLDKLADGVISAETIIAAARTATSSDPEKYLKSIKIVDIVTASGRWSKTAAEGALWHNHLDPKASVSTLLRYPEKVHTVTMMSITSEDKWDTVTFPRGWPWNGRLYEVFAGKGLPELDRTFGDEDDGFVEEVEVGEDNADPDFDYDDFDTDDFDDFDDFDDDSAVAETDDEFDMSDFD